MTKELDPQRPHCGQGQAVARPPLMDLPEERNLLTRLLESLPRPDETVERVALGGRFVAVSAGGRVGLASTLGAKPHPEEARRLAGLEGMRLAEAAGLLLEDSPLAASVGLAALNAGQAPPAGARELSAGDLLARLCRNRRVVVVGDFPFASQLRGIAAALTVLDLRPGCGDGPVHGQDEILGECRVAAISSTSLLTRSLSGLLAAAPNALKVLVGPSTPWSPRLFDLGADVLAGSVVADPGRVMKAVAKDLPFYEIKRAGVRLAVWARPGLLPD